MSLPTAPRTGQPAIDYAAGRVGGTMPDSGLCLQFVRENYAVPPCYYSAIDAWNAATEPHPDDRNPPPSAPVWFWTPSIYRHVAFHLGGGQVVSTYNAEIRSFPSLDAVEQAFGGPYMGWAPDLNEYNLRPPGGPTPPSAEEDNVQVMVSWDPANAPWFVTDWLTKRLLASGEPDLMRDLGIITPEAYALGARFVARGVIDSIPDAG